MAPGAASVETDRRGTAGTPDGRGDGAGSRASIGRRGGLQLSRRTKAHDGQVPKLPDDARERAAPLDAEHEADADAVVRRACRSPCPRCSRPAATSSRSRARAPRGGWPGARGSPPRTSRARAAPSAPPPSPSSSCGSGWRCGSPRGARPPPVPGAKKPLIASPGIGRQHFDSGQHRVVRGTRPSSGGRVAHRHRARPVALDDPRQPRRDGWRAAAARARDPCRARTGPRA